MHVSAPKPPKIGGAHIDIGMNKTIITNKKDTDDGWRFEVETSAGTEHVVTLSSDYHQELTNGDIPPQALIEKSFAFLLDNEPASAILSEFDCADIEQYFPSYPQKISQQLS
jgi:hypothetical protein